MAKPGPQPKDAASKRSVHVGLRITPQLKERLAVEAEKSDHSLSKEIELRIKESFDLDKSIYKLLGGHDYHYWVFRLLAEVIVLIEHQTVRHFVSDRFTFDQVKAATITVLDCFKPGGRSSPPKSLNVLRELAGDQAVKELGKRFALLALAQLEVGLNPRQEVTALPDFLDPMVASRHLSKLMQKPVIEELIEIWRREEKSVIERHQAALERLREARRPTIPAMKTTKTKFRRSEK
jgi:hypothetical protein